MLINLCFQTEPIIVHAQGFHAHKPHWQPIKEWFFATPRQSLGPIEDLTIITFNNGHEAMGVLERCLDHLGVPCVVLGAGIQDWVNSRHKPRLILEAARKISTRYIMGLDSRDVLVLDDPKIALERFKSRFKCRLLLAGDRLNWPNLKEFKQFEDSILEALASDFRYLNGGTWIGETEFVGRFFEEAVQTEPVKEAPESEQGILKKLFPRHHPEVQLDYRCQIFQAIGFVSDPILKIR